MHNSWREISLNEVAKPVYRPISVLAGNSYRTIGVKWWGMGAYERETIDGSMTAAKTLSIVREDDLIINKIWVRHGSVAIATKDVDGCAGSGEFPTFELNLNCIDPRWIHWQTKMKSFWNKCDSLSRGTSGKNRIKPELFLTIKIPLPHLDEQRRIIACIEALAERINEAQFSRKKAVEGLNALLLSAYHHVFSPKEGWKIKVVGDFCENPQYGYTESAIYEQVGPKFLRITDIQDGKVDWDSVPYCDCPQPVKYLLKPNDIVFARTGATTGKSFLINECPEAVFASYLIRIRVKHSILPEYLYMYFQSPDYWRQIADEKKGTGQPNVNGQKLANICVPIPTLDEQRYIVVYLRKLEAHVDTLQRLQFETQTELDALMPSILDKAFRGEL